ncbi:uncharacterized protein LOC111384311 isoform X2 [Olea europaea var. sylvestris]|uniref:uncharacterized protein LOC111384311 isoform X2 n=1 Tax=Olea europaea var. sylvestris TaxID=158386 RepID=UPI000C1D6356|nr:uncharacterized protein LOC111384311 isoform X2 [Olea europaea var. sylvestris]XP_022864971.1 uncharacterized protein LOC111384311 isoform X2 [Olea europaea var. sylvestris]
MENEGYTSSLWTFIPLINTTTTHPFSHDIDESNAIFFDVCFSLTRVISVSVWCRGRHKTVAFKGWRSSKDLGTTNSLMREGGLHGFLLTCQSELLLQLGSDSYLSFFAVIVQFGSGLHATVLESMLYIFYYI